MSASIVLLALLSTAVWTSPADAFGLGDIVDPFLNIAESISLAFRERGEHFEERHVRTTSASRVARIGEFDFIVVGAGVAGAVIANRLSEERNWTVLLLEAGNDENTVTDVPVLAAVSQSTTFNWGYKTVDEDGACQAMSKGQCGWPRGKVIGGSSVLNYMVHCRGDRLDYDAWAAAGNEGWGFDDLLPYFIKTEHVRIAGLESAPLRGHDGYLTVERAPYQTPLSHAFVRAGRELGFRELDYVGEGPRGFSLIDATMRNGSRCSSNKAYLRPVRDRTNLYITKQAQVTKVLIDASTKRAHGVEFKHGFSHYKVRARKEVIVSAGALNSPQLLMLSGIGPAEHLKEIGIPLLQDLKVGYNLQEHVGYLGTTFVVNQSVSVSVNNVLTRPWQIAEYIFQGDGPLTVAGGVEAVGYVRSSYAQDERHDIELMFVGATLAADDGTFVPAGMNLRSGFFLDYFGSLLIKDGFTIWPLVMHPRSRGRVMLRSKDPLAAPRLEGNFFSDPVDMKILIEGIKAAVSVGKSKAFEQFGARFYDKPVPGCDNPSTPMESDAYWECAARQLTAVLHHQVGTCKMGPSSDPDSVVDPQLRVHGIEGLRVADTSIIPLVPTAHTATPTYMVGEKAADMIKQAWGKPTNTKPVPVSNKIGEDKRERT